MSFIDQFRYELLDFFHCPSDFDFIHGNNTREIGIYRLLQNIPAHLTTFEAEGGDLLIGGGSGEAQILHITQKGIQYYFDNSFDDFEQFNELFHAYWSPTFAYIIGTGLMKLGWNTKEPIEYWMSMNVLRQLNNKGILRLK